MCLDTSLSLEECTCDKCIKAIHVTDVMGSPPEEGTDQARIFDSVTEHLVFKSRDGDSGKEFDDFMEKNS